MGHEIRINLYKANREKKNHETLLPTNIMLKVEIKERKKIKYMRPIYNQIKKIKFFLQNTISKIT
jgi:hypothetical protein